jgi:hypothetical protein
MRFKDLAEEFEAAKHQVSMADKHMRKVLDLMVKAGTAKVVSDDDYEFYIVPNEAYLLDDITSLEMDGEDVRYYGVDEPGRIEAQEQGCDPSEFFDEIVLAPGEKVEWFIKGRA